MTDESLLVIFNAHDNAWNVYYRCMIPMPITNWNEIDGDGTTGVWCSEMISSADSLGKGVSYARGWAVSSGFKIGATKIEPHGNRVVLKLRRP